MSWEPEHRPKRYAWRAKSRMAHQCRLQTTSAVSGFEQAGRAGALNGKTGYLNHEEGIARAQRNGCIWAVRWKQIIPPGFSACLPRPRRSLAQTRTWHGRRSQAEQPALGCLRIKPMDDRVERMARAKGIGLDWKSIRCVRNHCKLQDAFAISRRQEVRPGRS